jgi:ribosomal protein S18 acetylase RimI-like enzyme
MPPVPLSSATASYGIRPLGEGDVDAIVAIDRAHTGRMRRRFFGKCVAAAKRHPDDFVHIGVMRGGSLRGFAFARLQRGEFGRAPVVAVIDAVGVEPQSQEIGIGQTLMNELIAILRQRRVTTLQSQVDWRSNDLLHFFNSCGFELAPRLALERAVSQPLTEISEEV